MFWATRTHGPQWQRDCSQKEGSAEKLAGFQAFLGGVQVWIDWPVRSMDLASDIGQWFGVLVFYVEDEISQWKI